MPIFARVSKRVLVATLAVLTAFTTACASGGYRLTRRYSSFVNHQNVVLRVIVYILTFPVFGVTLLIDGVINNTVDFWEGRVAQGTFRYESGGRTFVAQHATGADSLKSSHIETFGADHVKLQDVGLTQTSATNIEVWVDGVFKHRVSDIHAMPQLASFTGQGQTTRSLVGEDRIIAAR